MNRLARMVGVIAIALASAAPAQRAASPDAPTSEAARAALKAYKKALADASLDYVNTYEALRDDVMDDLEAALKAAMTAADLDEANRIKALVEGLRESGPPVGGWDTAVRAGSFPRGAWSVTYLNGNRHVYQFDGRGGVKSMLAGHPVASGKLRRQGRDLTVTFDGRVVERFSFAGDRLFVEYFGGNSRYPDTTASDVATGLPTGVLVVLTDK